MKTSSSTETDSQDVNISRRRFLQATALGTAGIVVASQFTVTRQAAAAELPSQKNILLIITDQERLPMWFPSKWAEGDPTAEPPIPANLPNTQRLVAHGLTFANAFTAAAMCTPSRNCMFTGLYVPQHRSPWTLTEDTDQAFEEHQLDPSLPNVATCLKEAGYDVVYKGKWHMSKRVRNADGVTYTEDDIDRYGFDDWDAPDAGGDAHIENFGGADALNTVHHDQRFIDDAVSFLTERIQNPTGKPFCLIVSLVNPHDVLSYPNRYSDTLGDAVAGGYKDGYEDADPWIERTNPPVELPPTLNENLLANQKPTVQVLLPPLGDTVLGPLATEDVQLDYLNFYGRLMTAVDGQIGELLDVLDPVGDGNSQALRDTLVIRTSDHGEMGLCHGGLRQKMFVAYEEVVRVPLIWSNPELFPSAKKTQALVSHVDLLPTLCALTGITGKDFKGVDYSHVILDPDANTSPASVRDHITFTFDDIYAAGDRAVVGDEGAVPPPNRIQMVRTVDYKLARYYDGDGIEADQGEFYDLTAGGGDYYANNGNGGATIYNAAGPLELENLYGKPDSNLTPQQIVARQEMEDHLAVDQTTALAPRETDDSNSPLPTNPDISVRRWTDEGGQPQAQVEVTFFSRENETYQLQRSLDLQVWENIPNKLCAVDSSSSSNDPDQPAKGNNGPIAFCDDLIGNKAYYRLLQTKI